jgi:tRNA(adenine34) deaminase
MKHTRKIQEIYLPSEDLFYMRLALQEAKIALAKNEVPIGAVVVFNHQVIGSAHNLVESRKDPTAHAEVLAIQQACNALSNWRLEDAVLYSSLEPCLLCSGAILLSRIGRVVWGAPEFRFGADGSCYDLLRKPPPPKTSPYYHPLQQNFQASCCHTPQIPKINKNYQVDTEGYLLAEESLHLLQAFFIRQRTS